MNPSFYLVGGAVRDHVLGRQSNDRDYVVVGATPEWMLANGYTQVGASFPVFLHPTTGEEYALARQERKTGKGYHGFDVTCDLTVTLEEDLKRRDLTINSMAMTENGQILDPFNGLRDLHAGILRHTSEAFAEDPLRVLRVARFAARYTGFRVAPETMDLMKTLVRSGELATLSRERIWAELHKGLKASNPARMIEVLRDCGATDVEPLSRYFTSELDDLAELSKLFTSHPKIHADDRFLLLFPDLADVSKEEAAYLRVPLHLHQLAVHTGLLDSLLAPDGPVSEGDAEEILDVIKAVNYTKRRDTQEIKTILRVLRLEETFFNLDATLDGNLATLNRVSDALSDLDIAAIVEVTSKRRLKETIRAAQVEVINSVYKTVCA